MEPSGGIHDGLAVPNGLTPELVDTLRLLDDAPPGVAEATIALLPYGSRSNLAAYGVIGAVPDRKDAAAAISITPYGREVIAACARHFDGCGDTNEHRRVEPTESRREQFVEAIDRKIHEITAGTRQRIAHARSHHHIGR